MNKRAVSAGLAAGLAGGLAGTLLLTPGVALGQSETPPVTEEKPAKARTPYADAIAALVADGTLTQAQADKVLAALKAARPEGRFHGGHGGHHKLHVALDTAAHALGMTVSDLRTALRSGQSIADVARSKGVALQTVVDALVAELTTRLAAKVTAGDLTQAQADAKLAAITARITEMVNADGFRPGLRRAERPERTSPDLSPATVPSA